MKVDKSLELLSRAEKVIPVQTQTFSKGPNYFPKGVAPVYLSDGFGSHVWDVDNNKYIDYICALGPVTLGYRYPRVDDAIKEQLKDGISFSLPHPLEVELAELLVDIIPCAEMVRFLKTGSEATSAAIRVARAYTGRMGIAFRGYHGWHEWYAVASERDKGISKSLLKFIHQFEYNNIESLEYILQSQGIAAVIMEPTIATKPKDNFLSDVLELTHKYGALLIFDEIVTGFRMSLGGAQEYFNVIPDLATFGKGMANGMPLNCVVGKREIMREFEDVFVSSTFGGEALSLAAGLATIQEMRDKNTIRYIWELGKYLMNGINVLGGDELHATGYPCRPMLEFNPDTPEVKTLFIQEVIKEGILMHSGTMNLCYSHTEEDIDKTLEAFDDAVTIIRQAVMTDTVVDRLEGEIIQPTFKRL